MFVHIFMAQYGREIKKQNIQNKWPISIYKIGQNFKLQRLDVKYFIPIFFNILCTYQAKSINRKNKQTIFQEKIVHFYFPIFE
jgi:hypothetical protein